MASRSIFNSLVLLAIGCADATAPDPGLEQLDLAKVAPDVVIPGTALAVEGASFVDAMWGSTVLHLVGSADGTSVDVKWDATFVDFNHMTVAITGGSIDEVGGEVEFDGTATIEVVSTQDGQTYKTSPLQLNLQFKETLEPTVTGVIDGVHFINDEIQVDGSGFLLGGDEGTTIARVTTGGGTPVEIPLTPRVPYSRTQAAFVFSPKIQGIQPGDVDAQITIINQQAQKPVREAAPVDATFNIVSPQIFSATPNAVSLGQYVLVEGGGFVGGEPDAYTELELRGTFNKTGGNPAPIQISLIPEFVAGKLVRYVLNTEDALGRALDLRSETGQFTGTLTPITSYGADTVRGQSKNVELAIAPVRQVVLLNFLTSYTEQLRDFGMRAVDSRVRARILEVCKIAYEGVNIEFRTEPVTDFALFSNIDLTGVDPNGMGLFGYDNSPGKDNNNVRLYDRLGGVNALTQQDGYAGYGGVFIRSLMGFSKHPIAGIRSIEGADSTFDRIFDPFRPDTGGGAITSADLAGGFVPLEHGAACPGSDRTTQTQCAVFVLGSLIGGTLAHEIGHSLGLANPNAEGFHNAGDQANRLMDSGGDRPFSERAELNGLGPGVFCDEEYAYLRQILPTMDPEPDVERPGCY